jgi:DNA-binding NarL/FixJ family response regulator
LAENDLGRPSIRVLVVDDFEPFRRFVISKLQSRPALQVVGQAADGLEAVEQARELQPDLILLDIGLPKSNGLVTAGRIRKILPNSKILFVSQETSVAVVQQLFNTGANGYVVKTQAVSDLLTAVDAVLRGERFVSERANNDLTPALDASRSGDGGAESVRRDPHVKAARRHEAVFCSNDEEFVDAFGAFIERALNIGGAAIVVVTASHHQALASRLKSHGIDLTVLREQGRYIALDVEAMISTFIQKRLRDSVEFRDANYDLIDKTARALPKEIPVAVCGEGVSLLCEKGNFEATLRLEHLWNEIVKERNIDLLCGYFLSSFQGGSEGFAQRISEQHSAVHSR